MELTPFDIAFSVLRSFLGFGFISIVFCLITREHKHPKFTRKIYINSLLNSFGISCFTEVIYIFLSKSYLPSLNSNTSSFGAGYLLFSILIFLICYDFLTYWIHRALHLQIFYKRLHSYHHSFHPVTSGAAAAAQTMDGILIGQVPIWGSVYILEKIGYGISFSTVLSVLTITGIHSLYTHSIHEHTIKSGFIIDNADHVSHHRWATCNYSSLFRFWDKALGTYKL